MPDDEPTSPTGPEPGGDSGGGTPPDDPGPSTILSRRELRAQRQRGSRTAWYVLCGVAVVVVAAILAVLLTRGTAATKAIATTTTTTHPVAVVATCPLTGTPAPVGTVPARPALAVKIGNYTGDRPSTGLNQADIVFEEPVEGGITRLVAVFQCQAPAPVGDVRSAREPDVAILSQLSDPI